MRRIIKYFLFGVLLALISACYDSEDYDVTVEKEVAQTVTFTLNSSDNSCGTSSTTDNENITGRSLTDNEENTLNTANVLAFVDDGAGNYSFSYRSPGRNITLSSGTTTFKVDLKQYPNKQLFVILANSNSEITAAGISIGDPLETALSKLVSSCSTEWPARNNGENILRHIPMYGKTAGIIINSTTTNVGPVSLVRMLARIDVRVKSTVTNFQLKEACIFNRKDRGFIAYKDTNWDNDNRFVTRADVPTDASTTKLNNILYQTNSEHEVLQSIYTFEARGVTDKKDATAIVVGGYFDYPSNQSEVSYYRVDIPEYDNSGNQISGTMGDVLRNYLYNIEIQKVTNKGYDTPEEAFNGVIKVDANIVPWNLATMDEVKYEGIYSLKIGRSVYNYLAGGASNEKLVIETKNYQGSWEGILEPASATSWIKWKEGTALNDKGNLTGTGTTGITVTTVNFDITNNTTGENRQASLKIKMGGLTKYIKFSQTNLLVNDDIINWQTDNPVNGPIGNKDYTLAISRASCKYDNSEKTRTLTVTGSGGGKWKAFVSPVNGADCSWITLITSTGTANGSGTELKYTIKPYTTTGSATRSAKIRVTLYNLCKEILIEQYPYAAIEASIKDSYKKDNSVIQSFTVVSRAPWKARVTSDTDKLVEQLRTPFGSANTIIGGDATSENFPFTLNTISGSAELKATITFSSTDGEFDPYPVTITGK